MSQSEVSDEEFRQYKKASEILDDWRNTQGEYLEYAEKTRLLLQYEAERFLDICSKENAQMIYSSIYWDGLTFSMPELDGCATIIENAWRKKFGRDFTPDCLLVGTHCKICGTRFCVEVNSYALWNEISTTNNLVCVACSEQTKEQTEHNSQEFRLRVQELKTMPYREYLLTPEWTRLRSMVIRRAESKCELCNNGGTLHVHHKTYDRRGWEYTSDLIVLCKSCHEKFHDIVK